MLVSLCLIWSRLTVHMYATVVYIPISNTHMQGRIRVCHTTLGRWRNTLIKQWYDDDEYLKYVASCGGKLQVCCSQRLAAQGPGVEGLSQTLYI